MGELTIWFLWKKFTENFIILIKVDFQFEQFFFKLCKDWISRIFRDLGRMEISFFDLIPLKEFVKTFV